MKRKISYVVGIIVIICLVSIYSFVDRQYPVYDKEIPTEEYIQCEVISGENTFSQSFYVEKENLNAVSIKCNIDTTVAETELTYVLYDESGEAVRTNRIKTGTLENGKFNQFTFDEITDCKGEKYTFEIKCEQEGSSGVYVYKTGTSSSGVEMKQNGTNIEGTLILRTVTHMFDWETFVVVSCFVIYIVLFIRMLYKFFR